MTVIFDSASRASALPVLGSVALDSGNFLVDIESRMEGIYDYFSGGRDPVSFAAMGMGTSVFTIISSSVLIQEGRKEYEQAKKAHDIRGIILGAIKTLRSGVLITVSIISIPVRILTAIFISTMSRIIVLGLAFFSNLTGVGFLAVDLLNLVTYCIKIHEQRVFMEAFRGILYDQRKTREERLEAAVVFLKQQLQVTPEERAEIEEQCAAFEGKERLNKIQRKVERLSTRKEAQLHRVLSRRCIEMIRADGIDSELLIRTVNSRSQRNLVKLIVKLTVVIVAVLSLIAGMVVVNPVGIIAVTVFTVVSSVALLAIDLYDYLKDFKKSDPGQYDTSYLTMSTILGFAVTITSVLCAANITALALAIIFGIAWLITNAMAYMRVHQLRLERRNWV